MSLQNERAKRASLVEYSSNEVREMATDIMATSTAKLTGPIRLARSLRSCFVKNAPRFALRRKSSREETEGYCAPFGDRCHRPCSRPLAFLLPIYRTKAKTKPNQDHAIHLGRPLKSQRIGPGNMCFSLANMILVSASHFSF